MTSASLHELFGNSLNQRLPLGRIFSRMTFEIVASSKVPVIANPTGAIVARDSIEMRPANLRAQVRSRRNSAVSKFDATGTDESLGEIAPFRQLIDANIIREVKVNAAVQPAAIAHFGKSLASGRSLRERDIFESRPCGKNESVEPN